MFNRDKFTKIVNIMRRSEEVCMHFIGPISVTWYDFIKKCLVKSVASKTSLIIALFWYEIAPVIVEIDYVLDNLEVSSFL